MWCRTFVWIACTCICVLSGMAMMYACCLLSLQERLYVMDGLQQPPGHWYLVTFWGLAVHLPLLSSCNLEFLVLVLMHMPMQTPLVRMWPVKVVNIECIVLSTASWKPGLATAVGLQEWNFGLCSSILASHLPETMIHQNNPSEVGAMAMALRLIWHDL